MVATEAGERVHDSDDTATPAPRPEGGPTTPSATDGLTVTDRRRLRRAWWVGSLPMLVIYTWILTGGTWNFFGRRFFDDFFDIQARALLEGHLDVPTGSLAFEGFIIDGRTYLYFGPVPSLLRMPVMLFTDRFDGRLTILSMLLAMVLFTVGAFRLGCVLRAMVRGEAPVGRRELLTTAGLAVAAVASPVFFLGSVTFVYHEAELWGVALTIWALVAVARWQREPSARRLVAASLWILAALLSRQTVGLAPLAALGLAGALVLAHRWRTSDRPDRPRVVGRLAGALALAGLIPLMISFATSYAKFGQVAGLPMDKHVFVETFPERRAVIEANPTFVGPEYIPTTVMQYFSVTALDVRSDFPYLDFPRYRPKLHGEAVFDKLDWTSSLPVAAPALVVLGLGGLGWAAATRRRRRGDPSRALSPLVLGGFVGGAVVLAWAYVANRYLCDLVPFALVAAMIGYHAAGNASARWRPAFRRAAIATLGVLTAFGALVNIALTLEFHYERGPSIPEDIRVDWVEARLAMPGSPDVVQVAAGDLLPAVADGTLAVVGDCDGLYLGVGDEWHAIERGPGAGVYEVEVDLDRLPDEGRVPLATFGTGDQSTVVAIGRVDDGDVRVDVLQPEFFEPEWTEGTPVDLDGTVTLRIDDDPRQQSQGVHHERTILTIAGVLARGGATLGEAPDRPGVASTYPGGVTPIESDGSLCRDALG